MCVSATHLSANDTIETNFAQIPIHDITKNDNADQHFVMIVKIIKKQQKTMMIYERKKLNCIALVTIVHSGWWALTEVVACPPPPHSATESGIPG